MSVDEAASAHAKGAAARVLITVPCFDIPGGVANYYRTLQPLLNSSKRYFEVGARPGKDSRWAKCWRLLSDYWRFHRELGRHRFDLVHINPSLGMQSLVRDGLFLLIAKGHRRPVLVFFHGWDPVCETAIRCRYARLFRSVYGRADAFVVLAEEFARRLRAIGIRAPITVETTIVTDSVFEEEMPDRERRSNLKNCEVLYMSRLDRDKGLVEAIEAVAQLGDEFPSLILTVAGDGPERAESEKLIQSRGLRQIAFVGHLGDSARAIAFRRADIFLFPTLFGEGMPTVVLEAMAFGLPVVTRAVGGIRDFFEDGQMGFVTESRAPSVFAGFLSRLAGDPALRASMGRYNREYARGRFAASVVAARLLEIYVRVGRQTEAH